MERHSEFSTINVQKGNILISYPFLEDDYFYRSVICMMEHNDEGSFGLIVNKKMPYTIGDVWAPFSHLKNHIYMGGPVETNSLFFLHPYKDLKDTIKVMDDLYWNGDIHELKDMFELDFANPSEVRFFLGYSGWSPHQLKEEIVQKSWLISEPNISIVFDSSDDDIIWRRAIESLGDEYGDIAHAPTDPLMN